MAIICRLSGRQQKRGRKESAPALLAGLSILLNTLTLLADYTPEELAHFAMVVFNPLWAFLNNSESCCFSS
ncbi:hypothetical protein [Symbiopectobacterium sp. RP]|uniref:hypothetical protein n=1 Tax=Symbiopectobacterium sp. RP TaxID=3248553 RepID=UPI003D2D3F9B